jgi:hypothetical protein
MFKGKVMRLKTGLTKMNKTDKTIPAKAYPAKPPLTVTPSKA